VGAGGVGIAGAFPCTGGRGTGAISVGREIRRDGATIAGLIGVCDCGLSAEVPGMIKFPFRLRVIGGWGGGVGPGPGGPYIGMAI
jgi:hypothetical protein